MSGLPSDNYMAIPIPALEIWDLPLRTPLLTPLSLTDPGASTLCELECGEPSSKHARLTRRRARPAQAQSTRGARPSQHRRVGDVPGRFVVAGFHGRGSIGSAVHGPIALAASEEWMPRSGDTTRNRRFALNCAAQACSENHLNRKSARTSRLSPRTSPPQVSGQTRPKRRRQGRRRLDEAASRQASHPTSFQPGVHRVPVAPPRSRAGWFHLG